jgi:hypothetical protein
VSEQLLQLAQLLMVVVLELEQLVPELQQVLQPELLLVLASL